MTNNDRIPPMPTTHLYFVVYDGFQILDLCGPAAVFAGANAVTEQDHYQVHVVSYAGGSVAGAAGPRFETEAVDSIHPGPQDTLFVVGAGNETALAKAVADEALKAWLIQTVSKVARYGSFCLGSFVLADAGLLANQTVATHWAALRGQAPRYDDVHFDGDSLYKRDKRLWTSAGATTGIDMALAMVEADLGRNVMGLVAQRLVLSGHRHGTTAQKSRLLEAQVAAGDLFPELIAWLDHHLDEKILVGDMANRVGMSERNFYRKFTDKIGLSPSKYLEQIRLERARNLLAGGLSVKATAPAVGYPSEAKFRRAYRNQFGVAPSQDLGDGF